MITEASFIAANEQDWHLKPIPADMALPKEVGAILAQYKEPNTFYGDKVYLMLWHKNLHVPVPMPISPSTLEIALEMIGCRRRKKLFPSRPGGL